MGQFIDLTGQRFGRWTVLYRAENRPDASGATRVYWHCKCDCGAERDVKSDALKNGRSESCGCLHREKVRESGHLNRKHGMKGTRIYSIWSNMCDRCYRKSNERYGHYGGRGIKVSRLWRGKDGFMNFYTWAVSHGYRDDLTIDRIDNDGNYCPANCRWVSYEAQSNNRSNNRRVEIDGEEKTIAEWARHLGIKPNLLYRRSNESAAKKIRQLLAKKQT